MLQTTGANTAVMTGAVEVKLTVGKTVLRAQYKMPDPPAVFGGPANKLHRVMVGCVMGVGKTEKAAVQDLLVKLGLREGGRASS